MKKEIVYQEVDLTPEQRQAFSSLFGFEPPIGLWEFEVSTRDQTLFLNVDFGGVDSLGDSFSRGVIDPGTRYSTPTLGGEVIDEFSYYDERSFVKVKGRRVTTEDEWRLINDCEI